MVGFSLCFATWLLTFTMLSRKVIVENGVKLRLNIVDTPGYGDQVNNENWYASSFAALTAVHTFSIAGTPS